MLPDDAYSLDQLAAAADVSPRTVRYYIQQGLLPAPEARGPGAHYGGEHLDRLRIIRRLQREHLPLAEIRRRMEGLSGEELRAMAGRSGSPPAASSALEYVRDLLSEGDATVREPAASYPPLHRAPRASIAPYARDFATSLPPSPAPAPPARKAAAPVERSQWDRITLAPDVELHLRRPLSREQNRQVERLLEAARRIFQEDAP